jgi:hypothetical protein
LAGITRQAICQRPKRPPNGQPLPLDPAARTMLSISRGRNPTDGTRMNSVLAAHERSGALNPGVAPSPRQGVLRVLTAEAVAVRI